MKTQISESSVKLWLSATETWAWAHKPGKLWPCSFLAGSPLFAEFDRNGLVDFAVNYGRNSQDCPSDELSAICADFLAPKLPLSHPARFVAVEQFLPSSVPIFL